MPSRLPRNNITLAVRAFPLAVHTAVILQVRAEAVEQELPTVLERFVSERFPEAEGIDWN